jgi:hypothetical protein
MLSLRVVISVWMGVALILIAAITLSITLTSSLKSLRDIGGSHALALLENTNLQSAHLFDAPYAPTEAAQLEPHALVAVPV